MADDANDIPDVGDISLVNSTPPEPQAPEPVQPEAPQPDKSEDAEVTPATDDTKEETPASDTQQETSPEGNENEPSKEERDRAARQAWQQRQRSRQEFSQQIQDQYAPKSEQDLIQEGLTPEQANVEALRQEMNFARESARVADLNAGMRAEAVEVQSDFGVFNPKSPDYDEDFTKMVETQYRTASRLQTDDNGLVLNAEVPLYDFYQQMAQIYNRGTSRGTQQAQQNSDAMISRTENPGGSSSTRSPGNETLEELEERIGNAPLF